MSDQEPAAQTVNLLARVQELVDAKPPEGGHPLEWAVPAYYLGDMSALAIASLRAPRAVRQASTAEAGWHPTP